MCIILRVSPTMPCVAGVEEARGGLDGGGSSLVYRLYRVKSARLQPDQVGREGGGGVKYR